MKKHMSTVNSPYWYYAFEFNKSDECVHLLPIPSAGAIVFAKGAILCQKCFAVKAGCFINCTDNYHFEMTSLITLLSSSIVAGLAR